MELFNEIEEFHQLLFKETSSKLDCDLEKYQDLESKYSNLHESYSKEIENSKKVEKCLVKCLKFYSKLCKKYEAQQKVIVSLEQSIQEKIHSLEESLKAQEKLKGLIEVYRTERILYSGISHENLRKDKEVLLDICCKLISESVKTNNVRNLANLILKKFKKDLDDEKKINLLKLRDLPIKKETSGIKGWEFPPEDFKLSCKLDDLGKKSESGDDDSNDDDDKEFKTESNVEAFRREENLRISISEETCRLLNTKENSTKISDENRNKINTEGNCCTAVNKTRILNKETCKNNEDNCSRLNKEGGPRPANEENSYNTFNGEISAIHNENYSDQDVKDNCSILNKIENSGKRINEEKSTENKKENISLNNGSNSSLANKKICNLLISEEACSLLNNGEQNCNQLEISNLNTKEGNSINLGDSNDVPVGHDVLDGSGSMTTAIINNGVKDVGLISNEKFVARLEIEKKTTKNGITEEQKISKTVSETCEETILSDEDLSRIFEETAVVRMLSPIRELNDSHKRQKDVSGRKLSIDSNTSEIRTTLGKRRNSHSEPSKPENKKLKSGHTPEGGLLDSIISAMSQQNEEFKCNANKKSEGGFPEPEPFWGHFKEVQGHPNPFQMFKNDTQHLEEEKASCFQPENSKENSSMRTTLKSEKVKSIQKIVMDELKSYVCLPMSTKEEADKYVKKCVSVLSNKPEEIIVKSIVAIVFENVDETIEVFERPAPPLTKTQHRLVVLLSVFKTLDCNSEKLWDQIQSLIWDKFFPDKFFWPDDCIETATRFYTALCKLRNDLKTQWKFCLQAMTEMKQRSCLVVFTALKTWPDFLHNAATLQNNILAVTMVNIFLHMAKADGLKNFNQKKKLLALKHLLMNFYQFKVEDTIENYTQKVFQMFYNEETGAEKALVLLAKCRDWSWTSKNILVELKKKLKEWAEEKIEDGVGVKILSVVKQISVVFINGKENANAQAKEIISCLSGALSSRKLSHATEQSIIELLIQMKQQPEARTVIREWVPKVPIGDDLRNEIINISSENILREVKTNKRKTTKKKSKKKKKKSCF